MIQDIIIDWAYLLATTFAVVICFWLLHFVCFELNLPSLVKSCVKLIQANIWTSLVILGFLALITLDALEKQRRHRNTYWRGYD
mmetsp:Transcript_30747/g.38041  ORF Transcript_30747/g.38041 Transcript_30747/m.38041 type:complete len:84 (-) Transcript_30747:565-816(-)